MVAHLVRARAWPCQALVDQTWRQVPLSDRKAVISAGKRGGTGGRQGGTTGLRSTGQAARQRGCCLWLALPAGPTAFSLSAAPARCLWVPGKGCLVALVGLGSPILMVSCPTVEAPGAPEWSNLLLFREVKLRKGEKSKREKKKKKREMKAKPSQPLKTKKKKKKGRKERQRKESSPWLGPWYPHKWPHKITKPSPQLGTRCLHENAVKYHSGGQGCRNQSRVR